MKQYHYGYWNTQYIAILYIKWTTMTNIIIDACVSERQWAVVYLAWIRQSMHQLKAESNHPISKK